MQNIKRSFHRNSLELKLLENRPLRLSAAEGRRVECLSGIVWITACGEAADFILRPGQVFEIPNNGLTLVEAIGHCQVRVEQAHAPVSELYRSLSLRAVLSAATRLLRIVSVPHRIRLRYRSA
jgi:hypothetical protein